MADLSGLMKQYSYFDDGNFQPEIAQMCLDGAKEYLKNADVVEPEGGSALYNMACYMLANHWYENRGVVAIGTVQGNIALGVESIIWQLSNGTNKGEGGG